VLSDTASIVAALGASNAWTRGTAARLLQERQPTNSVYALRRMLDFSKWSVARLEALRSIEAQGTATLGDLSKGLKDQDTSLRLATINMAADRVANGRMANSLWNILRLRSADRSSEIRLHLALALGAVHSPASGRVLAGFYLRDSSDAWMQRAMLTAHPQSLFSMFNVLVLEPGVRQSPSGRALLQDLATSLGLGGDLGDVSDCLGLLGGLEVNADETLPLVLALAEGLEGRGLSLSEADESGTWLGILRTARAIALQGTDEQLRALAVEVMGASLRPEFVADESLLLMFAPGLPVTLQTPVIEALARQGLDRDFAALTQRWHLWDPPEKLTTLNALLRSEDGAHALLTALDDGTIPVSGLTSVHNNLLREHPVSAIQARAARLLGPAQPNRDELVSSFVEALNLQGSAARGRELFRARCSYCHQTDRSSFAPPLAMLQQVSPRQLVAGIVDPSRDIAAGYATAVLGTVNDRMVWGIVRDQNPEVIQLVTPEGARRYLHRGVRTTDWSLMPDNTAAGLTRQDVADLVEFVRNSTATR
jgi:putative heme-binding domain-containing protein